VRARPVLIAVLAGVALLSAAPAQAGKRKTVRIYDNYYLADSLTVKTGTTITWKWPGYEEAGDVHDVKLKSGPKGVKKFHSEAASTDYSFKRKLTKPGKYKIVCTLHEEMRMTIRVKR
jgi:plastocyanin